MRLFTSSSRQEFLVVVLVLLGLGAVEGVFRVGAARFSGQLRALGRIKASATALASAEGHRLLVLGNSHVIDGFDEARFLEAFEESGRESPRVVTVAFRGARFGEWYWLYRFFFQDVGRLPDEVMVMGNVHLGADPVSLRVTRLAMYTPFSGLDDVLRSDDLEGFDEATGFLHAWASVSYANGSRVRVLTLDALVSGYREGKLRVQRILNNPEYPPREPGEDSPGSLTRLRRFLSLAASRGIVVTVVFMPALTPYEIDQRIPPLVEEAGGRILDLREVPGMKEEEFADATHLAHPGAVRFSAALAARYRPPGP